VAAQNQRRRKQRKDISEEVLAAVQSASFDPQFFSTLPL